jgi:hypothetical protein
MARTRSPNYPVIDLEAAVEMAAKLERFAKRHAVPVESAMQKAWDLKPSGYGFQCVGALKQFGLLQEDDAVGQQRQVKLTEDAQKVVHNHPDRPVILRAAALRPKVHTAVWSRFDGDLPPDDTIKTYLLFEHQPPFNPAAVPEFIGELRRTISFAGLDLPEVKAENESRNAEKPSKIKPGDFIQWESGGVLQFVQPRPVSHISEDGRFVFVEGNHTGLPIGEVGVVEAPASPAAFAKPAGTPPAAQTLMPQSGFKQDVYNFADGDGQVILQYPDGITPDKFEEFEQWIALEINKIRKASAKQKG